jgi:aminoglycoside phosphotransferase
MNLDIKRDFKNTIWQSVAENICARHGISCNFLKRSEHGESIVFLIDERFVVKIYVPFKNGFERERKSLESANTNLRLPDIVAFGEFESLKYLITTQLHGEQLTRDLWLKLNKKEQISILSQLAAGLRQLHRSDATKIDFDWHKFIERQANTCVERQKACGVNSEILKSLPGFVEENLKLLPMDFQPIFLHGDVHFGNLRFLRQNGRWRISGLFDFADSLKGLREYDFLAVGVLMIQGQGDLQLEFFRFFDYPDAEIDETLRKRLMLLTCFYEWSDLRRYALRLRPEAVNYSLEKLETAIWNFS